MLRNIGGDSKLASVTYELVINPRRRFAFIPHDLRYFQDHFVCEPMGSDWKAPPVTITGKSYKSADFVVWMQRAPIVSPRAKDTLGRLCSGLVEFLPFHAIKGIEHFAMNVLSRDRQTPIYKVDPQSVVFVSDEFGKLLRDHELSGAELANPSDNIGQKIVRGETVNVFPGLVG